MSINRILDANFNRAREALRVMEDAARFVLNRRDLAEPIKTLRHDLSALMAGLPNLNANRNTLEDVGTTINTVQESIRESTADVAIAAGKRFSEAIRSLEEFSKTLNNPLSDASAIGLPHHLEQLRYRGYEIERRLNEAISPFAAKQWKLCALITRSLCALPWQEVLDQIIDAGCDCIQVREKDLDAGELFEHASAVVQRVNNQATVIINDRADIAMAANAHGVHVGQSDLCVPMIRKLFGRQLIVGISTHKLADAEQAMIDGADYCGIGPMFPSTTKVRDFVAGTDYLTAYTNWNQLPHLAIGGITPGNIEELKPHGLRGVAASSVICGSKSPRDTTLAILDAIS